MDWRLTKCQASVQKTTCWVMSGLTLAKWLKSEDPSCRIIHHNSASVSQVLISWYHGICQYLQCLQIIIEQKRQRRRWRRRRPRGHHHHDNDNSNNNNNNNNNNNKNNNNNNKNKKERKHKKKTKNNKKATIDMISPRRAQLIDLSSPHFHWILKEISCQSTDAQRPCCSEHYCLALLTKPCNEVVAGVDLAT